MYSRSVSTSLFLKFEFSVFKTSIKVLGDGWSGSTLVKSALRLGPPGADEGDGAGVAFPDTGGAG